MIAQTIYDLAMDLMDEKKDLQQLTDTPVSDYDSTKDYQARTPGILTILQTQIVMYLKSRGVDIDSLEKIETLQDNVELDDDICSGVLPYGLAARLLGQEDSVTSKEWMSSYFSNLAVAAESSSDKMKGKQVTRENIYGLFRAGD